jgi:hypothetical protein
LPAEGKEHELGAFHGLRYKGNLGALVMAGPPHGGGGGGGEWPQTMADRPGELAGRPTIFTDGTLAPPLTSLVASKSFSRSVDATKAHDMTMAGGASFNGGIFLAEAVVDRALKGSMVGERMNKSFGREVRKKEMS